jgi:dephospho-CoA kinase
MSTVERCRRARLPKEVIGLTGVTASGKTVVARILESFGFKYTSLRDMVRYELIERDMPVTRENLKFYEEKLVAKRGRNILAVLARSFIISTGGPYWVVEGIINPQQVAEFRKLPSFFMVGTRAPTKVIFERMHKRKRRMDSIKLDELEERLNREMSDENGGMYWNISRCFELADYIIDNDVQFDLSADYHQTELYAHIERMLRRRGTLASLWRSTDKN